MVQHVPRRPLSVPVKNPNFPKDLPIIGLGCSSFSHFFWSEEELRQAGGSNQWKPDSMDRCHVYVQEWIQTIHYAIDTCGITLLDTAPWYGHGTSEMVLGWAFEELFEKKPNLRKTLTINTKVGRYEEDPKKQFDFSYDTTILSVERSLRRMNLEYIDILQLHDPEFSPSLKVLLEGAIPAMIECRKRGLCKSLGITGYPLETQHQIICATVEKFGEKVFDQALTYCHYNIHDTSLFSLPLEDGRTYADFTFSNDMNLMAAAPLSMGLLTHNEHPTWHPASDALKEACKKAAKICEEGGVNISSLAIRVALSNLRISCTILGMKNIEQVKIAAETAKKFDNLRATKQEDGAEFLKSILQTNEYEIWMKLSNKENGPFSSVWRDGTFRWDGVKDAKAF
eukprot:CAMPEP_0194206098 /NCGR_PEP_ID=MMETSP0156-20130528/5214_1 /TAXON_ID=33649 /ORGANISM="Thalassionema nitzschioides, Strain L26-B" /LENGTH=396 /DNA_ID=CAMNT_0038932529 /DNA_START=61 /DNA_END=1248 /DNA_ORIENTATION=+